MISFVGEKFVLDQVHGILENLWTVDPTLEMYPFPGKIQHSKHVMPYERKHTRVPQTKRYRKIASLPELKRYTDRVLVYSTKCSFINFFLGHNMPMDHLMNSDVEYQVVNDQMRIIVKDVQALVVTTAAWLVGMDPVTTNCSDLAETLRGYSQFHNLPIHVKVQQLKIEKTDNTYEWKHPKRIDVVTIQCAHHLRRTTVQALIKTFNSSKPRDV